MKVLHQHINSHIKACAKMRFLLLQEKDKYQQLIKYIALKLLHIPIKFNTYVMIGLKTIKSYICYISNHY